MFTRKDLSRILLRANQKEVLAALEDLGLLDAAKQRALDQWWGINDYIFEKYLPRFVKPINGVIKSVLEYFKLVPNKEDFTPRSVIEAAVPNKDLFTLIWELLFGERERSEFDPEIPSSLEGVEGIDEEVEAVEVEVPFLEEIAKLENEIKALEARVKELEAELSKPRPVPATVTLAINESRTHLAEMKRLAEQVGFATVAEITHDVSYLGARLTHIQNNL